MGDKTAISWTDATWNPVRGCSRVSEGCRNCYAERVAARFSDPGQPYHGLADRGRPGSKWTGEVRLVPEHLADPLRWKRPRRIFVASMSDPFHDRVAERDIDQIFAVMAMAPQHQYQLLTKRPQRMREYVRSAGRVDAVRRAMDAVQVDLDMNGVVEEWRPLPSSPKYEVSNHGAIRRNGRLLAQSEHGGGYKQVAISTDGKPVSRLVHRLVLEAFVKPGSPDEESAHRNGLRDDNRIANLRWASKVEWPLSNVWLGVSAENQDAADDRIPELLDTPAAVRFVSCEPLLGELSLFAFLKSDLRDACLDKLGGSAATPGLDWVIVGCESGPGSRPCEVAWIRALRDECADARVPMFLKQAVESTSVGDETAPIEWGEGSGRKGRHIIEMPYLDGEQHVAFPEVA